MEINSPLFKILFLGKYQFYLELLIPMLITMFYSKRRKYFWIFLPICIALPCFTYWMPNLAAGGYNFNYIFCYMIVFVLSFFLYDESPLTLLCAATISFGVQHICWNGTALIYDLMPNNASDWPLWAVTLVWVATYLVVYTAFFFVIYFLKKPYRWQKKDSLSLIFGTLIILIAAVLSQYVTPWTIIARVYTVILMLLGVSLEFIIPIAFASGSKARELEDEKSTLTSLIELQAKQAETSKKEQEILNMKFHDMKHQIVALKEMKNEDRVDTLEQLEKAIDVYGAFAKTGNETLDIILTQKSLLCSQENITFTYVIDGNAFSFMSYTDLSSLFGNIIDNAIEAVRKEEGDNRLIKLSASIKNGFVSLTEENYSSDKVKFSSNGLPISNKENQAYHGFGSKSIKYIAHKYGGTYSFEQKGDCFKVFLLFPSKK